MDLVFKEETKEMRAEFEDLSPIHKKHEKLKYDILGPEAFNKVPIKVPSQIKINMGD